MPRRYRGTNQNPAMEGLAGQGESGQSAAPQVEYRVARLLHGRLPRQAGILATKHGVRFARDVAPGLIMLRGSQARWFVNRRLLGMEPLMPQPGKHAVSGSEVFAGMQDLPSAAEGPVSLLTRNPNSKATWLRLTAPVTLTPPLKAELDYFNTLGARLGATPAAAEVRIGRVYRNDTTEWPRFLEAWRELLRTEVPEVAVGELQVVAFVHAQEAVPDR